MIRPAWLVVAKRELSERLRSKWFIAVTLLGPLFMIGMIVVPAVLAHSSAKVHVAIVDESGIIGPRLETALRAGGWQVDARPSDTSEATLMQGIRDDVIDGFVRVPKDVLDDGTTVYKGDNATSQVVSYTLQAQLTRAVQLARGARFGMDDTQFDAILRSPRFVAEHTTGTEQTINGTAAFALGYAVMFIIYLSILLYGANVLRSVIQEKTSRVAEIMVAAAKPDALLLGKIMGVGGAGLVQMGVWLAIAGLLVANHTTVLGWFGVTASFALPSFGAGDIVVVLAFFLAGFFFYASLFAALGAMVSSEQEAQAAQTPLVMLLIIPVMCVQLIASDPRGTPAAVMTQIPLFSAMLMPMRYLLGGATLGELLLSLAILCVGIAAVAVLAARIYRVGLLAYGTRPSLRELWRWLRKS